MLQLSLLLLLCGPGALGLATWMKTWEMVDESSLSSTHVWSPFPYSYHVFVKDAECSSLSGHRILVWTGVHVTLMAWALRPFPVPSRPYCPVENHYAPFPFPCPRINSHCEKTRTDLRMFLNYSSRAGPAKNNVQWNWEISWLTSSREPGPANQIMSTLYFC